VTTSIIPSTISPTMTPSLNPMFRFQWEKAQDCFVLLFPEGMVKLNGGAGEIIQLIDGEKNLQQITDALHVKFPDAGDLTTDVNEFITTAIEKKWLYYD
jgi:pyrroloquinoline quinone biosynthesis protein D